MKKVSWIVWICIVIIIVSATMIILYFNKTWSPHLSSDAGDWSDFGGFLSPLVSLITMIILLITIQENKGIEERNLVINKKEELGEAVIILYQLLPVFLRSMEFMMIYVVSRWLMVKKSQGLKN